MLDLMTVTEELQLFGWRKGAFTGAVRDSVGSVQRAQGGTLFIDEVDKLSLKAQTGLLHVLEERNFRVLGESGEERHAEGEAHLSAEAAQSLQRSSWPGNLRQLDNVVRRAYTLALVEHGESPREVHMTARHVERALASEQLGREQAFTLLGREYLLKNRNHHKALRRELEKIEALYKALGSERGQNCGAAPEPSMASWSDTAPRFQNAMRSPYSS